MASQIQVLVNALWQGEGQIRKARQDIAGIDDAAKKSGTSIRQFTTNFVGGLTTLAAAAATARQAWDTIGEGAQLELASSRLDNLAGSIGAVSDALMSDLREATHGMVSDAQLVRTASDIISLGLADTSEGVTSLASLIAELGWDMQTVIMTFANDSKMRLDQLGLSVEDVTARAKALEAQGLSATKAFDQAVIDAGRAKLELLGSAADTTAGSMARTETAWRNMVDNLKQGAASTFGPAIVSLDRLTQLQDEYGRLLREGQISEREFRQGIRSTWTSFSVEQAEDYFDAIRAGTDEFKLSAAEAEENRRSLGALADAYTQVSDAIYTTQAAREVSGQSHADTLRIMEQEQALLDALARGYELTTEATEQSIRTGIEAWSAYRAVLEEVNTVAGRDFASALEAGEDAQADYNQRLFEGITALESTPEIFMAAGQALTDYSEETLAAALRQAAMNEAIAALAPLIADGTISIQGAVGWLRDLETQLEQDYTAEMDTSSLVAAEELARGVKNTLDSIRGDYKATVSINTIQTTTFASGGSYDPGLGTYVPPSSSAPPSGGPSRPPGAIPGAAMGTSYFPGGLTWVGEQGPELVALPQGSRIWSSGESERMAAGSGGQVYNDNRVINQIFRDREAAALGLAQVQLERRGRIDRMMGRA